MTRNILLTSLNSTENDRSLRYYSAQNEFGYDYCEAAQSMEASAKYILARFQIDEILVIGEELSTDDGDDLKPIRLRDASALYSADSDALSAFELYRSRIAQFIDELSLEQQAYDALLVGEERAKLTEFIRSFQEQNSERETKRLNRFFDELACSRTLYAQFKDALFAAFPEARREPRLYMKWVKNYLYTQLRPSARLEILPVNENICARYIPAGMLGKREYWVNNVLDMDAHDGNDEINLFISLASGSAVDEHLVMNLLDILISMPGSSIRLKKVFKVYEPSGSLTGSIEDNTAVSRTTDLVTAAHAFLNYNKTDMLVDFWEQCEVRNEWISSMIYAAQHVDVGISICNIQEVQEGIQRLRELFRDERPWLGDSDYGLLFGLIAGNIQADFGALLEGDGSISFIELIKWAYRHQLYQQVLTLIEAHAPANLVKTGVFYYCDDEARAKEITKLFAQQRLEMKSYEYYKLDDVEHYFVKYYDRAGVRLGGARGEDRNLAYAALRAKSIENRNPEKISGHTVCDSMETVQNVLYAYFHLGEIRNKISHSDSNAMAERRLIVSEKDISYYMLLMRESIEYFIMSYEKAMEEVRGKNPKIVFISPNTVRDAADNMRRERMKCPS